MESLFDILCDAEKLSDIDLTNRTGIIYFCTDVVNGGPIGAFFVEDPAQLYRHWQEMDDAMGSPSVIIAVIPASEDDYDDLLCDLEGSQAEGTCPLFKRSDAILSMVGSCHRVLMRDGLTKAGLSSTDAGSMAVDGFTLMANDFCRNSQFTIAMMSLIHWELEMLGHTPLPVIDPDRASAS